MGGRAIRAMRELMDWVGTAGNSGNLSLISRNRKSFSQTGRFPLGLSGGGNRWEPLGPIGRRRRRSAGAIGDQGRGKFVPIEAASRARVWPPRPLRP